MTTHAVRSDSYLITTAVLVMICLTHAAERFWWHVLEDRPIIEILRRRKREVT